MGAVYQGWQKSLDRFAAIKILPSQIEDHDGNFAGRFKREAKAMARFSHPGIVSVYDAGETPDGLLYFVMDYVEGTDLHKTVAAEGALPAEQALAISSQICDALAYAHQRGVIHRDIKPSNIMIDAAGRVKVADFGIAKVANDETASLVTGTHMRLGTPDFMAPEALHKTGLVDHRADLYAVGVMLYQMLTGEVPRGRFDLPSVRRPGLDLRFDAIVDRAMQKDPEKRYASAVEIRGDLERIARDGPHGSPAPRVEPDGPASTGSVSTKAEFRRWTESIWMEGLKQRLKHWLERLDHWSLAKTAIFFGFNVGLAVLIYSDSRVQPMEKVFLAFLIFFTALTHLWILQPRTVERNSRILLVFGVILLHLAIVKMVLTTADN
jgi:serine/threonine protein kinase